MANKPILTVFTPTYNRADTLVRTYESLCRQTCKDFKWLIIDDGSTDNTSEVVKPWLEQQLIPVKYIHKENGGLITGYNTALEHIDTELNVCIDSDDFMPDNAVEIILREWGTVDDKNVAGLIGLDYYMDGGPIGGLFSKTGYFHYYEKFYVVKHKCDTKAVCRTDLMKKIAPLPTFGEKHFNPNWYYNLIGQKHSFKLINECLCIVDYQPDGMMAGIFRQYKNSPLSFAEMRRLTMRSPGEPFARKCLAACHYISSSIFSGNRNFIKDSPNPFLTMMAIAPGCLLHMYILMKLRKQQNQHFKV